MIELLIATTNRGKVRELQALLADFPASLHVRLPDELGIDLHVEETGLTYAENATLKARAFCQASGMLALADDSGLEVAALGGAPGLYSARYAPLPGATDADRRAFLLLNLADQPAPWSARFVCTVAIAVPDGRLFISEGECRGEIILVERGNDGFGYDPIFLVTELGRTMAELSMEEKNRLSHRARAVRGAYPLLQQALNLS
jgi:XTP/dITP diphosphohydrolase